MRTLTLIAYCLVTSFAALPSQPGTAQIHTTRVTFRDIEFDYPRDRREAVGQAMLAQAIPIGSPVVTARDILRDRGAHCRKLAADGVLRCTFGAFDTIEDHLQDVTWEIRVASNDGKVEGVRVLRLSRGS
jgi:hypothetical protein